MGCNSSKDGSNPQTGSDKAPAARGDDDNTANTNQVERVQNENDLILTSLTDVDKVDVDTTCRQTHSTEDVNNDGQVIINEDTENKSVKDTNNVHHGDQTPLAEEDNTVKDGDIVVENVQHEQSEVKVDESSSPSHNAEDSNNRGEQGAPETTESGEQNAEEQNLEGV